MGFFGVRRIASKDHSSVEKVLTPTRASASLLARLFSDSENEEDVAADSQREASSKATTPTVALEELDLISNPSHTTSRSTTDDSSDRSLDRNCNRNGDRKFSALQNNRASPGEGFPGQKDSLSRLAQRDSIKRSLSRKMARSESRRQLLNIKDDRTANSDRRRTLNNQPSPKNSQQVQLETSTSTSSLEKKVAHLSLSPVTPAISVRDDEVNAGLIVTSENKYEEVNEEVPDGGELGPVSEASLALTIDAATFAMSPHIDVVPTAPSKTRSRRRPPPLVATECKMPDSAADWPSAGFFGSDGGFMTGGFKITAEGMVGTPDLETRQDSDPEADEEAPRSNCAVVVRALKEFRNGPTIGAGAAGRVYIAEHLPSKTTMAVKVVNVYNKEKRNQLLKELETLCTHISRYLVRFHGAFYDGSGAVHIALEYMDHGCLATFVQRVGPIPESIVRMIGQDCLRGLRFLHRHHVLHRDFKTANILLSRKLCRAKLSDFGLARDLHPGASKVDTFVGTVAYMSPERLQGGKYTYASDIWALGVSLVECLLGRHPFNRPQHYFDYIEATAASGTLQSFDQEMRFSAEARDFITMCTYTDPMRRPRAVQLLEHPWIKGAQRDTLKFGAWLDECRIRSMQVASRNAKA